MAAAVASSQRLEPNRRRSPSDPFTAALRPPVNETADQRETRLAREAEARQRSDEIDEMIRQERNERRRKRQVKILLLGQSESGKSTTLKQFQLLHTPAAFHAERIAWRSVIYLNLVRSIRRILDAISPDPEVVGAGDEAEAESLAEAASIIISANGQSALPSYEAYREKLAPLLDLEERLIRVLSSPDEEEATHLGSLPTSRPPPLGSTNSSSSTVSSSSTSSSARSPTSPPTSPLANPSSGGISTSLFKRSKSKSSEVSVHTTTNWKKALSVSFKPKSLDTNELVGWWEDPEDPCHVMNACADAMAEMWRDSAVRWVLGEKRIRVEESSGFYLDEIDRICAKKYIPSNDDVLKARLKTMGVVEHSFTLSNALQRGVEWKIYDVGGARNQRQAWAPYFEDVNAIIFLAPISAFDQVLAEDPSVNRLEDSLILWTTVVSNKLLANVNIILFLNKCDLLQAKLDAGVRLNNHMLSYGDRPNDAQSVKKYFRNKFGLIHQRSSPNQERDLIIHFTSVTDTTRTHKIITNVRDMILRANLKDFQMI